MVTVRRRCGGWVRIARASRQVPHVGGVAAGCVAEPVTVEELTGVMRFESPDDYWTYSTSVAGPPAELVATLGDEQVGAIRATLDPSLASFGRDSGLELPWLSVVISVA
jgi:hypothetical protein